MNANDPYAADSVVVVDEAVEEGIDAQYFDGQKDNENEGQDEEEYWSEAADSDGDAKTEGAEVEDEEVSWSDVEDTPSALVASAHPINVQDGKSQNEAQECPTTKSATRTTSEYSQYICQHEYISSPDSHKAKQQTITNRNLCLPLPISLIPMSVTNLMM